jgi:disulfide bond formation protein DsbB
MTPVVQNVTNILSFFTVLADIAAVLLFVLIATPLRDRGWGKHAGDFLGKNAILFSALIGIAGIAGSLFYSQFANFAPCELCWVERAFLYTSAVIFTVAVLARGAEKVREYGVIVRNTGLTLSAIGFIVSAYHSYIQFGGSSLFNCSATGVSCEYVYFVDYGYVTIPVMALTAFALIILLMLFHRKNSGV